MAELYLSKSKELEKIKKAKDLPHEQFAKEHILRFRCTDSSFSRGDNGFDSVTLEVTNVGSETVQDIKLLIGYYGEKKRYTRNENSLYAGLDPGQMIITEDYANPGEYYHGGDIKRIVPIAYQYRKGTQLIMVDMQKEKVQVRKANLQYLDFEEYDTLGFEVKSDDSKGYRDYETVVTNNGTKIVDSMHYYAYWYDAGGNLLSVSPEFDFDSGLEPGEAYTPICPMSEPSGVVQSVSIDKYAYKFRGIDPEDFEVIINRKSREAYYEYMSSPFDGWKADNIIDFSAVLLNAMESEDDDEQGPDYYK